MMKRFACAAAIVAAVAPPAALSRRPQPEPAPIVIRARALLDVERGRLVDDAVVVVSGEKIVASGARSTITLPKDHRLIDLGDVVLLPGLIDAHVHLTLGGGPQANARATLTAGFTTVQDLGSVGYASVGVRDAINAGRMVGPRVVAAGPWLGISGGTCDFSGIGVRGADAFRARVRQDVDRGVDLIKVCVSAWLADAIREPARYEISDDELVAAIDEAHRLGKRVAVHALSAGGIRVAVDRGADLVAHGGFTPAETVDVMTRRGVYQLPTLFSYAGAAPEESIAKVRDHLRGAVRAGLPVAFGTDAGVIVHGSNAREFESLTAIGLSNADAIRAATISGAKAVGLSGKVGTLAQGAFADVIAVTGNPLEDLSALQRVTFVMKGGRIHQGRGAETGR